MGWRREERHQPHELPVCRTGVQLEVAPSVPDKIALGVGTVESEKDQSLLHHLLGLERDRKLCILVWYFIWGVRCPWRVGRGGEDHRGLGFLWTAQSTFVSVDMLQGQSGRRTLQNVHSIFLYSARRRSAQTWHVRWLHSDTDQYFTDSAQIQQTAPSSAVDASSAAASCLTSLDDSTIVC